MFSEGAIFLISLTTDNEPKPESNTSIGQNSMTGGSLFNLFLFIFKPIIWH